MSYCRFSTNNFQSDVYVYDSCMGGFQLEIARVRTPPQTIEDLAARKTIEDIGAWFDKHAVAIEHPEAGGSYFFSTLKELREKLAWLQEQGFRVPEEAFARIDVEMAAGRNEWTEDYYETH